MSSKEYHREYNRKRYHAKRKAYIEKLGGKCVSCGSVDELQFDHINPEDKSFSVGMLLSHSKSTVDNEIEKCQLLCKSCHTKKTKENKDGYDKKAKGESVKNAKLTHNDVLKIISMLKEHNNSKISKMYDVSRATIRQIRIGVTWKHIDRNCV